MSNDQSVFRFDLNESLYFEKGQEVAEIMGISLDPEISIQSFNEYISIRGVIELVGEYRMVVANYEEEKQEEAYFDDFHTKRFMESVIAQEDGFAVFTHRFPVEISVPTYRIKDLDDITVSIATFDYEMPDQSHLKLISTIEIHGISDHTRESFKELVEDQKEREYESAVGETFNFEIKKQKEDYPVEEQSLNIPDAPKLETKSNDETNAEKDRWKKKKAQTFAEFFKEESVEPEPSSSHAESHHEPSSSYEMFEESSSPRESLESMESSISSGIFESPESSRDYASSESSRIHDSIVESSGSTEIPESMESSRRHESIVESVIPASPEILESIESGKTHESIDTALSARDDTSVDSSPESSNLIRSESPARSESMPSNRSSDMENDENSRIPEIIESVSVENDEEGLEKRSETTDSHYLLGMFRAEEEQFTKMRLCIVQEKDTLESIAERYQTTSLHLASRNRLTDDTITQGQVLYVPYKKKKEI